MFEWTGKPGAARRGATRSVVAWCVAMAAFWLSGCRARDAIRLKVTPVPLSRREFLQTRAAARYPRAALRKPRSGASFAREADLAPLIVEQLPDSPRTDLVSQTSFGAAYRRDNGVADVDLTDRVVYAGTSQVSIDGAVHDQVLHLWVYPDDSGGGVTWRGIRTTLGADGFPLVWEVLSQGSRERCLYVSASLERAASASFGDVVPGRRHAVERSVESAPRTVVVRVIEDGPIPLGPYVYVSAEGKEVITLHCRCSPSQVDEFAISDYYELVPVESLDDDMLAWMPDPVDLSRFLRWVEPES